MSNGARDERVIVVGAGIVGIACAHYLTEAGWRVTVIDQGTLAGACSQGNCGYVCPSHVSPLTEPGAIGLALKSMFNPNAPFRIKPQLSPALWRWMLQFGVRCTHRQVLWAGKHLQAILDSSMAEYRRLVPSYALECEWQDLGLLYVFQSKAALEHFAEGDRLLSEHFGVAARRIESDELVQLEPGLQPGLAGAFLYKCDASVRPDRLNQSWISSLKGRGVQFLEGCALTGVVREGGQLKAITTSQGELTADRFVFAMGAWSPQWSKHLGCDIPIQPGKGYSVTLDRPAESPRYPMLFPEKKVGVSPFEQGLRLGSMMEFAGYDATIPPSRIQQLRDSAKPFLRANVEGPARETWYGWRPMTWDSLPIIGPVPRTGNAYLATGHNMLGLSLAPATGRLIGELLSGQPTHIDVAAFSPTRFG